jgi:DNA invertase Pin-like site-specific DNA recombinase
MTMSRNTKPAANPRVSIAYIRASKDEQKLSEPAQRSAIEAWMAREGVQVARWCVDQGVSSVSPIQERPGLVAALQALRETGAGILVVAKRDRIARDPMLTGAIELAAKRQGARVVSASGEGNGTSPADQFMRTVIDGASQYEHALIRARTSAALQAKRARGERVSARLPYGYALAADGVHLVALESEQEIISRARALAASDLSFAKISDALAREGAVSRAGRPFAPMQISRMLSRSEGANP